MTRNTWPRDQYTGVGGGRDTGVGGGLYTGVGGGSITDFISAEGHVVAPAAIGENLARGFSDRTLSDQLLICSYNEQPSTDRHGDGDTGNNR